MHFAPLARSLRFPRVWMSNTGRKRRGRRRRSATYWSGASGAAEILECRQLLSATTLSVDPAAPVSATNYHTIQSAVNAAVSGDTIKVAPGTYNESVSIASPLSNLTILGGQIHLRGESGPSTVEGSPGFTISGANGVAIEGFTIESSTGDGVVASNTQNSKIENNVVDAYEGIVLEGGVTGTLVSCNTLTGSDGSQTSGIDVTSGAPANINNQISDNRVMDYTYGIYDETQNDVVLDNIAEDNVWGITSDGSPVEGNIANQNEFFGIAANSTGPLVVSGNTANDNAEGGIEASATGALTVEHNTANDNQGGLGLGYGIECTGQGTISALDNTANGNTQQGIFIGATSPGMPTSAALAGNTAEGNGADGIDVYASVLATLSGNVANNNAGFGFDVQSGVTSAVLPAVSIAGNTADGNAVTGFEIIATAGTVSKNTADSNKGTLEGDGGFYITGSVSYATISFTGNVASKNVSNGFVLLLMNTTVSGNTADGNSADGFLVDLDGNAFSGNTADDNAGTGLAIDCGNTTVSGNTADNNGADGIHLTYSDGTTIQSNTTESNGHDGIEVDSNSSGNIISKNTALKNVTYDLQDESTGTGTAGTANTWLDNTAKTSNPSGLL